jgi:hypothetical protein
MGWVDVLDKPAVNKHVQLRLDVFKAAVSIFGGFLLGTLIQDSKF